MVHLAKLWPNTTLAKLLFQVKSLNVSVHQSHEQECEDWLKQKNVHSNCPDIDLKGAFRRLRVA